MLTPERWKLVERIFHEAAAQSPAEQAAFVESSCGSDDEIRNEVLSLLAAESRGAVVDESLVAHIAADWTGALSHALAGRTVDGYRLRRLLGAGGMGETYLAEDVALGRPVVLKFLPSAFSHDSRRVRRFLEEARAASALNHPGIVTVYGTGIFEGHRYIATEFIDGLTVRERLANGPLPEPEAFEIAIQAAAALGAAHGASIIHRDIKPENIMMRRDRYVKLIDFGLAKPIESGDGVARSLTRTGEVLGTADYMAPEQAGGGVVDARSDLYSLMVVFYEMLTGELPRELGAMVGRSGKRPLPPQVLQLVRCGVATDPAKRHQTAAELQAELEQVRDSVQATPGTPWIPSGSAAMRRGDPSLDQKHAQITRVAASSLFRHEPLLTHFLQFVASRAIEGQVDEISEYTIATEALGQPKDFDANSNTVVRTQARRLGSQLKAYYETEGRSDSVLIEIPEGRYVPEFVLRPPGSAVTGPRNTPPGISSAGSTPGVPPVPAVRHGAGRALWIGGAALALFLSGAWAGIRWAAPFAVARGEAPSSDIVNTFWKGIINKDESIILAYTNSVFFETETGDLLRFRSGAVADRGAVVGKEDARADAMNPKLAERAGPMYYEDGFTGTGEVLAAHDLTEILTRLGVKVIVKRSRLVNMDDLRNHNIIFLGSPFDNQFLADMRLPQRFVFRSPATGPPLWRGRIMDTQAGSGVSSYGMERDPRTEVIRADYAIFDVLPGVAPSRRIVVLAGITTSGTQGAAECSTSASGLRQVLRAMGRHSGSGIAFPVFFECVLRVEAEKGLDAMNVRYVEGGPVRASE